MSDIDCDISLIDFSIFLLNSTAHNVWDKMDQSICHAALISRRTKKTPHRHMTRNMHSNPIQSFLVNLQSGKLSPSYLGTI